MSPQLDTRQTCARCGHTGYDVSTRIVPSDDSVSVAFGDYTVPERFRAEPRCMDRFACDEREEAPREPA